MNTQTLYINALNHIAAFKPKTLFALMEQFGGNAKLLWEAPISELSATGFSVQTMQKFVEERKGINPEKALSELSLHHIEIMTHPALNNESDAAPEYPELLVHIAEPPPVIYYKGVFEFNHSPCLSVVGSRRCTPYGKRACEEILDTIVRSNIVIVSGLAVGIDSYAHESALKYEKPTIAVLANGLDRVYPSMNTNIVHKILETNGAVISEFPPGVPPERYNFPRRNRIIAGLSRATLIVEADIKSGSLITAYRALHENRDVFAIPGSIFSHQSKGTNLLIKQGAKLISKAEDILEEYGIMPTAATESNDKEKNSVSGSPLEEHIYTTLSSDDPIHINEIIKQTDKSPREVNSALTVMELAGRVENVGGGLYIRL
ncbi:MAG: DNA-protecting protein DprA [Candidatus Jacksonbacteria bacterium]|nr:DNA-protecting protein DprA [Candidatus Jacksonbacteria bacterium]